MKKFLLHTLVFLLLITSAASAQQQAPFYKEIQEFKKQDSVHFPPKKAILFIGSSSFTKWVDIYDYFPKQMIINRGFGGSQLKDVILYAPDIIYPYKPKQIVIYCGDNDLASSDTVTPRIVLERFKTLFNKIRQHDKSVAVAYVSIKPSPSRARLMPKMVEVNKLVRNYLKTQKKTAYIDIHTPMLLANGKPNPRLFLDDSLHMNAKGYAIWQKKIQPYLK